MGGGCGVFEGFPVICLEACAISVRDGGEKAREGVILCSLT